MNYHALQFLRSKGLVDDDKSEFIISFEDGRKFELTELLKEYEKTSYNYGQEKREQLSNGRHYLMEIEESAITVEDALEAFGFGRNGLNSF